MPVRWNFDAVAPYSKLRPSARREAVAADVATLTAYAGGVPDFAGFTTFVPPPHPTPLVVRAALETPTQIVQKYVIWSVVGGFLPFPGVDIAVLTAVNYYMIKELAEYYHISMEGKKLQDLLSALLAGVIPQSFAAGAPGALIRMIPVVGQFLSGFSQAAFAGSTTYLLGAIAISNFKANGGSTNPDALLQQINDTVAQYARWVEANQNAADQQEAA